MDIISLAESSWAGIDCSYIAETISGFTTSTSKMKHWLLSFWKYQSDSRWIWLPLWCFSALVAGGFLI